MPLRLSAAAARKLGVDVPKATRVKNPLPRPESSDLLLAQIRMTGLPEPVREFKFHRTRKWRLDLAYPDRMLAIEADGGTRTGGRHVRGDGYQGDCTKLNAAVDAGWRVLRFTTAMIQSGEALAALRQILERA
jgi:very-short-patch-repair endonuclease